jgi:hypothetical protein
MNQTIKNLAKESKRDLNDFIREVESPKEEINSLISATPYYLDSLLKNLDESSKEDKKTTMKLILKSIRKQDSKNKERLKELLRDVINTKALKRIRSQVENGLRDDEALAQGRIELFIGVATPRSLIYSRLTDLLNDPGKKYYNYFELMVEIRNDKLNYMIRPDHFIGSISNHVECYSLLDTGERSYRSFPKNDATAFFHSGIVDKLADLKFVTSLPLFDEQFNLIQDGYSPTSKIFKVKKDLPPAKDLHYIHKLLNEFAWHDPIADKANFLGVMLTTLIHHQFLGLVPLVDIEGNQKGLGKTLLAILLGILRDSSMPRSINLTSNEEELEKQLCASFMSGSTTTNFDNVKLTKNMTVVSNPLLEKCITDKELKFRILGGNTEFKMVNRALFVLTSNGAILSPDLKSRRLMISLYYEGDPENRNFNIQDVAEFCLKYSGSALLHS